MMGFIFVAVAVLSLLSAGQSAPVTDCETLIRPIEILGREQVRLITCHLHTPHLHVQAFFPLSQFRII